MIGKSEFYDIPIASSRSLQERLGRTPNAINTGSGVYATQVRGLLQMLNYGLDNITYRAASHLLNMDIMHANDAYLLKLCEGLLLNSIRSITPPMCGPGHELNFRSTSTYSRLSTIGTVRLQNGTTSSLVMYEEPTIEDGVYKARFCAGQLVTRSIDTSSADRSIGSLCPLYVSETYKSVWTDSLSIKLVGLEGVNAIPVWSMTELLSMSDTAHAVFCQSTPRGITVILGDGELFGGAYSGNALLSGIEVTYIKAENLSNPVLGSISLNSDIEVVGSVPVLSKLDTGDTPETLRSRSIQQLFANGKITDERDLVTELERIPVVRSCFAKREYDYMPYGPWDANATYPSGAIVEDGGALHICISAGTTTRPSTDKNNWCVLSPESVFQKFKAATANAEAPALRYDNATILLAGLMVAHRMYWNDYTAYNEGDVVYHAGTNALYRCVGMATPGLEPGSDDAASIWYSQEYLDSLPMGVPIKTYAIDEYEPITQASYELELKYYFGIWNKLGFTSVVVKPVRTTDLQVHVDYSATSDLSQSIYDYIVDYACFYTGRTLLASHLNAELTRKFSLGNVYVTLSSNGAACDGSTCSLEFDQYVPKSMISITLTKLDQR